MSRHSSFCSQVCCDIGILWQVGGRGESRHALPRSSLAAGRVQLQAGRLFHQWGEAVGCRLLVVLAASNAGQQTAPEALRQKELLQEDEEEDFLDEATVNPAGSGCPPVLQLVACMLLMEITAYMRETYKTVPKLGRSVQRSGRQSETQAPGAGHAGQGGHSARRWSTTTPSVTGQSTASHQSLHSNEHETRKISFSVLDQVQGQDNESIGSSKNSLTTVHDESGPRSGRLTQGKSSLLKRASSGSSFRYLKPYRRGNRPV